jgi:uncharacterized protein YggE
MLARWSITLVTVGLAVVALSACDSKARPGAENARQVTAVGFGEVQGVPDTLIAEVAIEFVARDVTTAMNQTSERERWLISDLTDAGVDRKDISTTGVSLQPQYGSSDSVGAPITGYEASNMIRVKITPDSASRVLATVVDSGGDATRINSVSYSIDDDSPMVRDARERAFNDAKERANQYAELSGLTLGRVISVSELPGDNGPTPPMPMPRGAMAAPVPVEPGQQTVTFSVTAVWELT